MIEQLITLLERDETFPYMVSHITNVRYLTGFTGSYGYLIIDSGAVYFITDSRYAEYSENLFRSGDVQVIIQKESLISELSLLAEKNRWKKVYIEDEHITYAQYGSYSEELPCEILPGGDKTGILRKVKQQYEIDILEEAARITDRCTEYLAGIIRPGMTEWDVVTEMTCFYMKNGCEGTSFDPIVASGAGSSMPHYKSSPEKVIEEGDPLLIDMGCVYKGYNSDLTRTFFVGYVDSEIEKIYAVVNSARQMAVDAARPGMTAGELDSIARAYIGKAGYGDFFGHALGHGVGLDIHEEPRIKKQNDEILQPGYVITIEPGIYIPGKGGVRIEDMVLITDEGARMLTSVSRDCIIVGGA